MPVISEIKFKFLKEVKDITTGKSKWQPYGTTSPPVNVEDVSVQTQSEMQILADGVEPEIIPYGVKGDGGRVASLTASFQARSMSSSDNMAMDEYLDVLQDDPQLLGYGLTLTGANASLLLPELGIPGTSQWRIEQFNWDRAARQLGQWKFNMTLGYIWDATANEIKLYNDGIGTNTPNNVKFRVTKGISASNYSSGIETFSPKVEVLVEDLNRASFKTAAEEFAKGDILHIYCETQPSKAIFFGVVSEVKKTSDGAVSYDCTEIGTILQRVPCAKISAGLFKPKVKIANPYDKNTFYKLKTMIAIIMNIYANNALDGFQPGYGKDRTGTWGNKDVIPGTDIKIPPQLLSGMTILGALDNLVCKQCGMHTWFDNDNGSMEYGFLRNYVEIDPTKEYILNTARQTSDADDFEAQYVVLYDNEGYYAKSVSGDVTGLSYIAYKIDTKLGDLQLTQMAKKIAKDIQLNHDTFNVTFPPGTVRFQDGDVFVGLGDSTVEPKMDWRGGTDTDPTSDPTDTVWQIKKMTITESSTECLVGASYYSVFDIYRDSLKRVSGVPVMTESKDVTTNERVVSAQSQATDTLDV